MQRPAHAALLRLAAVTLTLAGSFALAACRAEQQSASSERPQAARAFPRADRPVSALAGSGFSSEDVRDRNQEATRVMDLAKVTNGMTVADIGAGEGYYTVRLGQRVGAKGRVLAEDIDAGTVERLGNRVSRDRLENVSIRLGTPEDPRLPQSSFDRVFLIHMYHEVREPYAFLWNLRSGLRPDGRVVVVDTDRAPDRHGIPPALLFCEFSSLGFRVIHFVRKPELQGYYVEFATTGVRPAPAAIRPCRAASDPEPVAPRI